MKKPALIATIATGVVLVGGGAWGATMLAADDEPAGVEAVHVSDAPSATPEPTPTLEPTPEVTETAEPELSADESEFIYGARQKVAGYVEITDPDLLAAGYDICAEMDAWEQPAPEVDRTATAVEGIRVPALDGLEGTVMHNDINSMALKYLCPVL